MNADDWLQAVVTRMVACRCDHYLFAVLQTDNDPRVRDGYNLGTCGYLETRLN